GGLTFVLGEGVQHIGLVLVDLAGGLEGDLVEVGMAGGAGGVAAAGGEDGAAVADEALHERLVLPPVHPRVLGSIAVDDGDRDGAHGAIPYRRGASGQPGPGSGAPQWCASHPRGSPPPPAALDAGAFVDGRLGGSDVVVE